MLAVMVRRPSSSPPGMRVWLPATMMTAMVSPMARPMPRMTPDSTPERAAGNTAEKTLRSWVAPRASDPS